MMRNVKLSTKERSAQDGMFRTVSFVKHGGLFVRELSFREAIGVGAAIAGICSGVE